MFEILLKLPASDFDRALAYAVEVRPAPWFDGSSVAVSGRLPELERFLLEVVCEGDWPEFQSVRRGAYPGRALGGPCGA